jgi:hypothetical protein
MILLSIKLSDRGRDSELYKSNPFKAPRLISRLNSRRENFFVFQKLSYTFFFNSIFSFHKYLIIILNNICVYSKSIIRYKEYFLSENKNHVERKKIK